MFGRAILVVDAAVVAVAVSGGSAFAFDCFNANRSDQGNASAAKSQALESLREILANPDFVGLCRAGVDHVLEGLEDAGFRTDILINSHTLMAGGLEKNGKDEEKLHDGRGIDHLSEEFFETADPLVGEGFGICGED
jgi:hypothetical protein